MADFASLLRGSLQMERVIIPEDASSSRLIEVIETEDLPQGGGEISAAGLATLKKWVADKIQFDGPNPRVPPACLVRPPRPNRLSQEKLLWHAHRAMNRSALRWTWHRSSAGDVAVARYE